MNLWLLEKNHNPYVLFKEENSYIKRLIESGEGKIEEIKPLRYVDGEAIKYRSIIYIARSTCWGYHYSFQDFLRHKGVYTDYYKAIYDAEYDWWKLQVWK